jgi:predicted PurR-regulated permease PerM
MLARTFRHNIVTPAMLMTPESTVFMLYNWDQFWEFTDQVFNPPNVQADAASDEHGSPTGQNFLTQTLTWIKTRTL